MYVWGLLVCAVLPFAGQAAHATVRVELQGATMGTRYAVIYVDADDAQRAAIQSEITALFVKIDNELSNWNSQSWVSRFNRHETLDTVAVPAHAAAVLQVTLQIAAQCDGALDPTVSPLIELWGFGISQDWAGPPLTFEIEQTLERCGSTKLNFDAAQRVLRKQVPDLQLNLSSVAKGYAVDQVAVVLAEEGIEDYLINIGGEVRASGTRPDGSAWKVRIAVPQSNGVVSASAVILREGAIATSGHSQRFFEHQGQRYAHIIDPRSGRPVENRLRSVSVRAPSCAQADGLATACCVLGRDAGMALIESLDGVEALFYVEGEAGALRDHASTGW
ncbi:FAD:protein FMN transferase [Opitutales bacterium]|nr:FAD:protein FMN transferase [Opitutales bacterium]